MKNRLSGLSRVFFLSRATASRRLLRSSVVLSGLMKTFLNRSTLFRRLADRSIAMACAELATLTLTGRCLLLSASVCFLKPIQWSHTVEHTVEHVLAIAMGELTSYKSDKIIKFGNSTDALTKQASSDSFNFINIPQARICVIPQGQEIVPAYSVW